MVQEIQVNSSLKQHCVLPTVKDIIKKGAALKRHPTEMSVLTLTPFRPKCSIQFLACVPLSLYPVVTSKSNSPSPKFVEMVAITSYAPSDIPYTIGELNIPIHDHKFDAIMIP